jgi:hypothetical protein
MKIVRGNLQSNFLKRVFIFGVTSRTQKGIGCYFVV